MIVDVNDTALPSESITDKCEVPWSIGNDDDDDWSILYSLPP